MIPYSFVSLKPCATICTFEKWIRHPAFTHWLWPGNLAGWLEGPVGKLIQEFLGIISIHWICGASLVPVSMRAYLVLGLTEVCLALGSTREVLYTVSVRRGLAPGSDLKSET
jgi:hypothetical protein